MVLSGNTPTDCLSFLRVQRIKYSYSALQLHKKKERRTITRLQTPTPMGFTKRDPADTLCTSTVISVSYVRLSRKFMLQTKGSIIWRFVVQTASQNFLLLNCQKSIKIPWLRYFKYMSSITLFYSSRFTGQFSRKSDACWIPNFVFGIPQGLRLRPVSS